MSQNPELHYVDHTLNSSSSKYAYKFSRQPRFKESGRIATDYTYDTVYHSNSGRATNFGFGNRSQLVKDSKCPSPNHYLLYGYSRYGLKNTWGGSFGQSRDKVKFRSFASEIARRTITPGPESYTISNHQKIKIMPRAASMGKRLPTELDKKAKSDVPSPAAYNIRSHCINGTGRYLIAKYKNSRSIMFKGSRESLQTNGQKIGPGSYQIGGKLAEQRFGSRDSMVCSKGFGKALRKGPQDEAKIDMPGPGQYSSFSVFGQSRL